MNRYTLGTAATTILFCFALSWSGCYYDSEEDLYPNAVCDTTAVSYMDQIEPIVVNSCAVVGCHIAGGSGNGLFDNYAGLKAKVDNGSVMNRAVVQRTMPPAGPLSDCQINLFRSWINAGAPNN